MTFSQEWDQRYSENTHMSIWPWSDLVSLVYRYGKNAIAKRGRVLELGCGAGANIPLFRTLGMDYHALEGSPAIVAQLHDRFPDLKDKILCGDFTSEQPFERGFDFVVDRGSLTHNSTEAIRQGLSLTLDALAPGGYFFGVDWFSTKHSDFNAGSAASDPHTRTDFQSGQFVGVGRVHFSDATHLKDLFTKFDILLLEEKVLRHAIPADDHQFAGWIIVAQKKV